MQKFQMWFVFNRCVCDITSDIFEVWQMITLGGDAELELVDSLDPFSEGVVFSVRPPKKSWKNIANLSGGEKVTSLTDVLRSIECSTALLLKIIIFFFFFWVGRL